MAIWHYDNLTSKNKHGQTATELAIFGTILVFVVGILFTYTLIFGYNQSLQVPAFRQALEISHYIDFLNPDQQIPLKYRSVSVVIIEDRNLPNLNSPFGLGSRTTVAGSAAAAYNRYQFAEMTYGEPADLPVAIFIINGQQFTFTTAAFKTVACNDHPCPGYLSGTHGGLRRKVARGTKDYNHPYPPPQPETYYQGNQSGLYWKWLSISCGSLAQALLWRYKENGNDPTEGEDDFMDVDCDLKEELIIDWKEEPIPYYSYYGYWTGTYMWKVLDYQDGELDLTTNSYNLTQGPNYQRQGIMPRGGRTEYVGPGTQLPGTQLLKEEDPAKTVHTLTQKKTDIITRIIQLNPRHHGVGWDWDNVIAQAEVSCAAPADCCETGANKDKTCFNWGRAKFYVRSNLKIDRTRTQEVAK